MRLKETEESRFECPLVGRAVTEKGPGDPDERGGASGLIRGRSGLFDRSLAVVVSPIGGRALSGDGSRICTSVAHSFPFPLSFFELSGPIFQTELLLPPSDPAVGVEPHPDVFSFDDFSPPPQEPAPSPVLDPHPPALAAVFSPLSPFSPPTLQPLLPAADSHPPPSPPTTLSPAIC